MSDATRQQGFAHAMARMHMWLSGDDPELLVDYPQCRPIWVWCLAHNLAIGAALCRAFTEGALQQAAALVAFLPRLPVDAVVADRIRNRWSPGCRRSAP